MGCACSGRQKPPKGASVRILIRYGYDYWIYSATYGGSPLPEFGMFGSDCHILKGSKGKGSKLARASEEAVAKLKGEIKKYGSNWDKNGVS